MSKTVKTAMYAMPQPNTGYVANKVFRNQGQYVLSFSPYFCVMPFNVILLRYLEMCVIKSNSDALV